MPEDENKNEGRLLTTGEVAEACGVSVRTVQYYDERGLLHPTERSEGGRRLYDGAALKEMQTICTLKSLGLPLKAIRGVLQSDNRDDVLRCLLVEQDRELARKVRESEDMREAVREMMQRLNVDDDRTDADDENLDGEDLGNKDLDSEEISQDVEGDDLGADHKMARLLADEGTQLRKTQIRMVTEGIILDIVEIACLVLGFTTGNWWPLIVALPLAIIVVIELVRGYHRDARYVCPTCGATFQPGMREFFFAAHTPKTRKLTCTGCGKRGWCVEISTPREGE